MTLIGIIFIIIAFLLGARTSIYLFSNIRPRYNIEFVLLLIISAISGYYTFSLSNSIKEMIFWALLFAFTYCLGYIWGERVANELNNELIKFCHLRKSNFANTGVSHIKSKDLSEVFGGRTW